MSIRRATPYTLVFALVDSDNRPQRKSGVVFTDSSWCQRIVPGVGAVATANAPVHVAAGRYSLSLEASEMDADVVHLAIECPGADPLDLTLVTGANPSGTVVSGTSATVFVSSRSEPANDYWVGCLIVFTTGACTGQVRKVSAYVGATGAITVSAPFTSTPGAGDRFVLVNQ